jgi:hypothetical protein
VLARIWGKREPHTLLVGMQASTTTLRNNMEDFLKKLNIDLPYDPAIPLLGIYPQECAPVYNRATCTAMFIEALFAIAKLWKQPRSSTNDEWIKKMWYLYTMKFFSAIKKNEVMLFSGKLIMDGYGELHAKLSKANSKN